MNPVHKNLLVLLITLIILFSISELVIRVHYNANNKVIGINEEEVCFKKIINKVNDKSNNRRFNYDSAYHEYSNITGVRPVKNFIGDKLAIVNGKPIYKITYSITNNQHIKYHKNISKEHSTTRIVLLGDSFAWGADVAYPFSIAPMLEVLIPGSEVLNFGIEGTGIDIAFLRYRYESETFHPNITIFSIFIDDIRRAQRCIHKPNFNIVNNKLELSNFPPPSYEQIFNSKKAPVLESYFIKYLLYNIKYWKGIEHVQYDEGFALLDLFLDEIKESSTTLSPNKAQVPSNERSSSTNTNSKKPSHLLVLIIPKGINYNNTALEKENIKRLKQLLTEKDISFLDSEEIFTQQNHILENSGGLVGHFTPEGYSILAQAIKNHLESKKLIPPSPNYDFEYTEESYTLTLTDREDKNIQKKIKSFVFV